MKEQTDQVEELLYFQDPTFAGYSDLVQQSLVDEVNEKSSNPESGPHTPEQWEEADALLEEGNYNQHSHIFISVLAGLVAMDQAIEDQDWVSKGQLEEISHNAIQTVLFADKSFLQAVCDCHDVMKADPLIDAFYAQRRRHDLALSMNCLSNLLGRINKETCSEEDRRAIRFFEERVQETWEEPINGRGCSNVEMMLALYDICQVALIEAIAKRSGSMKNIPPISELGPDLIDAKNIACRCRVIEDLAGETLSHFRRWDQWAAEISDINEPLSLLAEKRLGPQIAEDVDLLTAFGQTELYRQVRARVEELDDCDDIGKITAAEQQLGIELAYHLIGNYHPDKPKLIWPREAILPKN